VPVGLGGGVFVSRQGRRQGVASRGWGPCKKIVFPANLYDFS